MTNTVRSTWAIPVSACLLGARLEAYVESKVTISTFRLCAQYGNPSDAPLAKLAPVLLGSRMDGHLSQSPQKSNANSGVTMKKTLRATSQEDILDKISSNLPETIPGKRFAKCGEVRGTDFIDGGPHSDDNIRYSDKTLALGSTSTSFANGMKKT